VPKSSSFIPRKPIKPKKKLPRDRAKKPAIEPLGAVDQSQHTYAVPRATKLPQSLVEKTGVTRADIRRAVINDPGIKSDFSDDELRRAERLSRATIKSLFGVYREKAINVVAMLAMRSRDERMRFEAAKYILDRTDGPVPRATEISGRDGSPIQVSDERPKLAVLLGLSVAHALGIEDDKPVEIPGLVEPDAPDADSKIVQNDTENI
jgi:hypothetical protein